MLTQLFRNQSTGMNRISGAETITVLTLMFEIHINAQY